jgi:hypothetical protein
MDAWTIALFAAATLLAISGLMRLMRKRRDEVTADLRRQLLAEQLKVREEKAREAKKQRDAQRKTA